jgi:hypothetical protein
MSRDYTSRDYTPARFAQRLRLWKAALEFVEVNKEFIYLDANSAFCLIRYAEQGAGNSHGVAKLERMAADLDKLPEPLLTLADVEAEAPPASVRGGVIHMSFENLLMLIRKKLFPDDHAAVEHACASGAQRCVEHSLRVAAAYPAIVRGSAPNSSKAEQRAGMTAIANLFSK